MSWAPTNDLQEELSLQPPRGLDYGNLWEPYYNYPRPKAHTEYAANRKLQSKEQQKENPIAPQMMRMESIKSPNQKKTYNHCENVIDTEQEIISMMRYCGIGGSDDQPLDKTITIATYPVDNSIKVVKNGRRTVALFFDENVFKLKNKVSRTPFECESYNRKGLYKWKNSKNDSVSSACDSNSSQDTSSSLS